MAVLTQVDKLSFDEVLHMKNKKNFIVHLISLCILCAEFILCRYVLFDIHGMKQLPCLLFVCGVVIIGISCFVKAKRVSVFTACSYIIGFLAGVIFQTDGMDAGGGKANTLWLIWTAVFVCCVVFAIASELVVVARKRKK